MKKELTVLDAKFEAQKLAFGPYYFQVIVTLRKTGILNFIKSSRKGVTIDAIVSDSGINEYGVRILLEAAESSNVVEFIDDDLVKITKVGYMINSDEMTSTNINFVNDVCYDGAKYLTESLVTNKPEGLKVFGEWPTLYEALPYLPDQVKKSWFEFDHYYSDDAFPHVLPLIFKGGPIKIFDIGGNTGKWSTACCEYDSGVQMTILDLPGQLNVAKQNVEGRNFSDRIDFFPIDLLDRSQKIPKGADTVWMSQFLDCFSESEIIAILLNVHQAVDTDTDIYILETFIDNQKFEAAKYSLTATSLYFTTMANGNSKMYSMRHMVSIVNEAGFEVVETTQVKGNNYHTLLKCKKKTN